MTAAIAAARQGASVTILEKKEMPGKKILSTGNGRCNLTNMDMKAAYFRGGDPGTVKKVLASFGAEAFGDASRAAVEDMVADIAGALANR